MTINRRYTSLVTLTLAGVLAGCSGSKDSGSKFQQSVAPSTSSVAPGGSHTTPGSVTPPPTTAPVKTPTTPMSGNTEVVVASALLGQVSVLDLATGAAKATIPVGTGPASVAIHGNYAYVANTIDQTVSVVDLLANQVTTTMDATAPGVTNLPLIGNTIDPLLKKLVRPTGIAVTPNGTKAFTANLINVTSYDLGANRPLKSIIGLNINVGNILNNLLGGGGISAILSQPLIGLGQARVACTDKYAYVTNMVTHNVTQLSATDDRVITNVDVGQVPIGVACAASKAYIACPLSNEIWVVDDASGTVKSHFSAGMVPVDVAASPKGDLIYVANFIGGDITVIDTVTDLPVNTLPAGISISNIFSQLGVPVPSGSNGGGLGGALQSFLQGFLGTGAAGSNTGLGGLLGGGGPISPTGLLNGLLSAFLNFAGINQQSLQGLSLPGIGVMGISISADGTRVVGANLVFGLTVTDIKLSLVSAPQALSGQGFGADAVAAGR